MKKLWLVGQWKGYTRQWEFQGVFSTKRKALKACKEYTYWMAPITLDHEAPGRTTMLRNTIFPHNR